MKERISIPPFQVYRGRRAVIATRHGKESAFGPALRAAVGLELFAPPGFDSDRFGTFTGEVPRPASPRETARMKARAAMQQCGIRVGIASEGSFGPHPVLPVPAAYERIIFLDDSLGMEIEEALISTDTNYGTITLGPADSWETFASAARFPTHALIVRPDGPPSLPVTAKGVCDAETLARAIRDACAASPHGRARLETDMRAHLNPTRRRVLRRLGLRLARRLRVPCPVCSAPGFGCVETLPGLPCSACGSPTDLIAREVHACSRCGHRETLPRPNCPLHADPARCPVCNP